MPPSPPTTPPSPESLKQWWKRFKIVQAWRTTPPATSSPGGVFGVPLRQSLRYASVQISTANQNNELYVWGYIPVVVAKCGLFLKQKGTEIEGIFRINGSNRRMRELQIIFETPPRYGKNIQWDDYSFTPHDVASIFRRFLTQMPEPIVPHSLYNDFRNAYSKKPFNKEELIGTYKRLIGRLPLANQYLLLYVLDLLTVFARRSDVNKMTATNLAVIFRPAVLNHPDYEMSPEHHKQSQEVLEFLIENQDWFMLDIPPPPRKDSILVTKTEKNGLSSRARNPFSSLLNQSTLPTAEPEDLGLYVGPVSDEEDEGGWKFAGSLNGASVGRRRTFSERGSPRPGIEADEQGGRARTGADARRSAENISSSAPVGTTSALKAAIGLGGAGGGPPALAPVREASSGEVPTVTKGTGAAAMGTEMAAVATAENGTGEGIPSGVGVGVGKSASGSVEGSTEGGGSQGRHAKFDDQQLAKHEETRRGRSAKSGGIFGAVRRSRTADGGPGGGPGGLGGRQLLKKRNSKGEVERVDR